MMQMSGRWYGAWANGGNAARSVVRRCAGAKIWAKRTLGLGAHYIVQMNLQLSWEVSAETKFDTVSTVFVFESPLL